MRHASSSQIDAALPAQLGARFSLKNGSMVFIPLLFYAFFCQSLVSSSVALYACLAVSFVSLVMHFLANGRFANKEFGLEIAWVPFFILFYVHSFVFGVNNLTLLVVYSILFACMYAASGEKEWISTCIKVLVAFAAFHATCTIAFWLFPSLYAPVKAVFFSSSYMASDYRSGFTAHYSTNSIYLSFGLVCWACGLIGEKSKPRAKDIALGMVFLLALFLTTKRGPLVASIVAVSICYLFVNRDKFTGTALKALIIVIFAILAVSVLATFVPGVEATLQRFVELSEDETGNGRSELYDCAWSMFYSNPLFGSGWGSYSKYVATTALGAMYNNLGFTSMSAHNVYLQLLAETGIVGLALFLMPAVVTLIAAMRRSAAHRGGGLYGESFCLWACVGVQIFFLVYCFSGNPLYDPQCYIPYFMSCVGVFAICGIDTKRKDGGIHGNLQ